MPRKGYRSVTITEETYMKFQKLYEEHKERYVAEGITSFTGFVTRFLYQALRQLEEAEKQVPRRRLDENKLSA